MRLLIVDDDIISIKAIMSNVDFYKYGVKEVFTAYSTEHAKKIINETDIDIMICDIEMPGKSGIELLQWIREQHSYIVSSFLTCHADFEYARESVNLEMYDYLLKPIPYEDIGILAGKMVRKREESLESEQLKKYGESWMAEKTMEAEKMLGNKKSPDEIVKEIDLYIIGHISQDLSLPKIAETFYLHPDYLNRIYKKAKGISIKKYIIQERMTLAAKLLSTTVLTSNNVAIEVGYMNYANFHMMFKKRYGLPPGEYKKKYQKKTVDN